MTALRKNLILGSPRSGCLEGRTEVIQRATVGGRRRREADSTVNHRTALARHFLDEIRVYSAAVAVGARVRRVGAGRAGAAMLPLASTAASAVRISASFCG